MLLAQATTGLSSTLLSLASIVAVTAALLVLVVGWRNRRK